ncbi:MAG: aldo/keto reductase [Lachnospiraceae bacterium]|nr:aldo/keto reductase [Lachnospiraceae bacterium]
MRNVTLGSTGISVPQNGFGALPIQRDSREVAADLLVKAYRGGMRFFDTARAYSDSEEKIGLAFGQPGGLFATGRSDIVIATKTHATTPEGFWEDLETSLRLMNCSYIDIYQFHQMDTCWKPGDGSGMYECMVEAKKQGKIRHIGGTTHKIGVAFELVESGLYETLQYPFSYLASDRDLELYEAVKDHNMGFICMKGLAGGLINHSDAAMAFMTQFDNALPIWGIQRESELNEWLGYMDHTPEMTPEISSYIAREKHELSGNFCRGCGYCMPCTVGITINQCNRMSLMLRRAPSASWLTQKWQDEMAKIDNCIECGVCMTRCPYELDIPKLLKENLADYRDVLAGRVSV